MSYSTQSTRYLENEILSRSPEWLVPLMYEHLLASLSRAAVQIETADLEGKAESLERASRIVLELIATLDHERGGDIAARLGSLYGYFAIEIINIGRSLDLHSLAKITELVRELHGAWVAAAEAAAPRNASGRDRLVGATAA